ncbi:MAG: hypothetical protein IT175_11390 [Acidobacteria bacterium]|nr:hypothetical protein [Acidobacteriota bacterium]
MLDVVATFTWGLSNQNRKAARCSPSAAQTAAIGWVLLTVFVNGCAAPTEQWDPMEAQQVAVTLTEGTTIVGVRDLREGWTEWVRIERTGQNVTGDIATHRVSFRDEVDLDPESTQFFRTEVGSAVADSGDTVERAYALCLWVADRTYGRRPERPGRATESHQVQPPGRELCDLLQGVPASHLCRARHKNESLPYPDYDATTIIAADRTLSVESDRAAEQMPLWLADEAGE